MKAKWFGILFACCLLIPWNWGCQGSSSSKTANLILYTVTERDAELKEISSTVYVVDAQDSQPQQIYAVQAPQQLRAEFSPDGRHVLIYSWRQVEKPDSLIPGVSFSLLTMDAHGKNQVTWLQDQEAKTIACTISGQFSADGKRLLYLRPADEDCKEFVLYTASADGKDEKRLDQASSLQAEFTPQGDRLLVTRRVRAAADKQTIIEVYYVGVAGGDAEVVWRSDKSGILASATYGGGQGAILEVGDFATGKVTLYQASADFKQLAPIAELDGMQTDVLTQSPDGQYIGLGRMGQTLKIFSVLSVTTGEIKDISAWQQSPFDFAANGKYLLVSMLGDYGDLSLPGVNQMLLEPNGDLIETLSPPAFFHSTLSPDGNRLAYWARDTATNEVCLHIRDLETGEVDQLGRTCLPGKTHYPGGTNWR